MNEGALKVQKLMTVRAVFACALLLIVVIFYIRQSSPFPLNPLFFVLWLALLTNLFYGLLFPFFNKADTLASLQITADLGFITLLVHFSGGALSLFNSLYILSIMAASMVISRKASLQAASLASILYGWLLVFEYYGIVSPVPLKGMETIFSRQLPQVLYTVAANIAAFYAVALLSGHLSERAQKAGQKLLDQDLHLKETLSMQDYVLQNISSGLITTDKEMRITSFNQAAQVITGRPLEEVKGRPWTEVFGLAEEEIWRIFGQSISLQGPPSRYETRLRRKDGQVIPVGLSLSLLTDSKGRPVGTVAIFQDLTAVKEMEERLRRSERLMAVGQLAAGIAHEIRNPLGSISGAIQMLQEDLTVNIEERKLMDIIIKETDRLNIIVSQFLDFARQRPLTFQNCPLVSLLEETMLLIKNSKDFSERHRIDFIRSDPALEVWGSPDQLKQIFWNLSRNALQAMPEGGRLEINLGTDHDQKNTGPVAEPAVWIDFEDEGTGIAPEDLPHIFDPFYTTKERGMGLGLSIVHRMVTDMGGTVEVENKPGGGARFRVRLPLKEKSGQ